MREGLILEEYVHRVGRELQATAKAFSLMELRYCGPGSVARGVRLPPGAVCNPIGAGYHWPAGKIIVLF